MGATMDDFYSNAYSHYGVSGAAAAAAAASSSASMLSNYMASNPHHNPWSAPSTMAASVKSMIRETM
jgi:hypothetical protein